MNHSGRIIIRCSLLLFFFGGPAGGAAASDSLSARIVWIENERVYFNAGTAKGISLGWRFCLDRAAPTGSLLYTGTIDRVYPDLSSAPAGTLSVMDVKTLTYLPDVFLFPPEITLPRIAHLRVGFIEGGRPFRLPHDIVEQPLISSLFYPWTRSGKLGGLGPIDDTASLFTTDGKNWTIAIDTTRWPGGEFPRGWGALADRLQGLISRNDSSGCPTFWALRPLPGDRLDKAGVYFDGFSQVEDTALGLNYATPFHTLTEYLNSGSWRRRVAAAWPFDPELAARPPTWEKIGLHTWARKALPANLAHRGFVVDTITVLPFADHDDQWLAFELGQLDLCAVSIDDLLRAKASNPEYRFVGAVQNALVVFGVNQQKSDLADNRLTTAVSYLVDKFPLVRALLADHAVVAHTILDRSDSSGEPYYPHDPRKGRRILKDLRLRRTLNFYVDHRIDRGMTVAKHIAGKLSAGGIETRLIPADRKMFAAPVYRDSMDIFLYLWPVDPDAPDKSLYPFLYYPGTRCGTNPLAVNRADLLHLLEKARQESEPAVRRQYYRQSAYRLLAEPFICPLYQPIITIMVSNRLPDIRLTALGEIDIVFPGSTGRRGKATR